MAQLNLRPRQQRRQIIIILFLLVLLLIGGAYYLLFFKPEKILAQDNERPVGQVAIPIASRNIELGERIAGNMFRVGYKKPEEVPPDIFLNVDQFVGRYATSPILQAGYFHADNISEAGVVGGYSAIAKPGKRVIVLSAGTLPGSIGTLNVGDHVDLLAIGSPTSVTATAGQARSAADSSVSIQGGGAQPGDPNSQAKQRARARRLGSSGINSVDATTATLVAENAEILRVPKRGLDAEYVVLQMSPQDAHVTTLMVASGSVMRVVFRPYKEELRITKDKEVRVTTRTPKPEADPDVVNIITGTVKQRTRPDSQLYTRDEPSQEPIETPTIPKNDVYSDTPSAVEAR